MSLIFLDFDGVLNTESWRRHCMAAGLPTEDGFGPVFDPGAVDNLADIRAWQERSGAEGNPYVILDDLPDFYPEQQPHYIETDPRVGISLEDAVKAILSETR